jgi:hypothetical protein
LSFKRVDYENEFFFGGNLEKYWDWKNLYGDGNAGWRMVDVLAEAGLRS